MKQVNTFFVTLSTQGLLGASLMEHFGKPAGARWLFIVGDIRHPTIVCSAVETGMPGGFVRLLQVVPSPDGCSSHLAQWVHSNEVLLVYERAQGKPPIGFSSAADAADED